MIEIYKLNWSGPFDYKDIKDRKHIEKEFELLEPLDQAKKAKEIDWGIYQIYGTHPIFGDNTLLYIGMTSDLGFAQRIDVHQREWILYEADDCKIYLGRFFSETEHDIISNDEWFIRICETEKLLIHFCTPPYNSQNIKDIKINRNFVLLSYGKHKRVPFVLTSEWMKSFPNSVISYYSYKGD
jgi:hypothetical protein